MKKYLYLTFALFLTFLFIDVDAKTIYLNQCEYTDEYKEWLSLNEEEREGVIAPPMCKNSTKNKFNVVGNAQEKFDSVSITDSVFDLRDYGYVTNVKNQGATGSCWAFATNASIESNLLVSGNGTYDLSEAHLELATQNTLKYNRLTFNRTVDSGANYYLSSAYLRNNWGPVLETTIPFNTLEKYLSDGTVVSEDAILNNKGTLNVNSITMFGNSQSGVCAEDTIKDIKEYLITNGAIAAMTHYGATGSHNLYQYYNGKSYVDLEGNIVGANQLANHAITIIGWDDTISKDSFLSETKPSRDGAFIIKNSYGDYEEVVLSEYRQYLYEEATEQFNEIGIYSAEDITDAMIVQLISKVLGTEESQIKIEGDLLRIYVGDNGYQYISYDDIHICDLLVGFFDVDNKMADNVYGYDDLGVNGTLEFTKSNIGYLASVFEKKTDKEEKLTKINIYLNEVGQQYDIYFANGDTKQLSQMELVATGISDFVGYHTISIDNKLITDSKYSIVIKLTSDSLVTFGVSQKLESSLNNMWETIEFTEGVQYVSPDGITYADTTDITTNTTPFHLVIKAYTNNVTEDDNTGDEDNTVTPPEDNEDKENETPGEDVVIPPSKDDETNNDGQIEILPSDMNNKNDTNNDESDEYNAQTGDNGVYILIGIGAVLLVSGLSYRKIKEVK